MKTCLKYPVFILLIILGVSVNGQDIYFTISGKYEQSSVPIDSIIFNNLNNETSYIFNDLPDRETYTINLTTRELIESTGLNDLEISSDFRILKNMPGQLTIACDERNLPGASIEIYNMRGQKIYSASPGTISGNNAITLNTGTNNLYLIKFQSDDETRVFKTIGSKNKYIVEICFEQNPSLKNSFIKSTCNINNGDFNVQLGDSLLVSAYSDTLVADPVGLIVEENNAIEFSFSAADSTDIESYFSINDSVYKLVDGFVLYESEPYINVYVRSIIFISSGFEINWDNLEILSSSGALINLALFNTQEEIANGDYPFALRDTMNTVLVLDTIICDSIDVNGDGIINEDDCVHSIVYTMPDGGKYLSSSESEYSSNFDINDFEFQSGNVTTLKEGEIYIFHLDCIGKNGDLIKGYYKGSLRFYDYAETDL